MRKVILLVAMAAALAIVSTAVAVAAQQSPGFDPQDEWSDEEMRGWMADEWDEMPRFGGLRDGDEGVGWCHGIGSRA